MSDSKSNQITSADQIRMPPKLPPVLLKYSMEVIRASPSDMVKFSRVYFE
jgi:hypothetical protein